jgi:hypothetical protein
MYLYRMENDSRVKAMEIFSKIHGVGGTTAEQWYSMGIRSIEDVLNNPNIQLTHTQRVGLANYYDKQRRIPRDEVTAITEFIQNEATKLWPGVTAICCGSYRRGKPHSGDCDILMTHPQTDGSPASQAFRRTFLSSLLVKFRECDPPFLTADLQLDNRKVTKHGTYHTLFQSTLSSYHSIDCIFSDRSSYLYGFLSIAAWSPAILGCQSTT